MDLFTVAIVDEATPVSLGILLAIIGSLAGMGIFQRRRDIAKREETTATLIAIAKLNASVDAQTEAIKQMTGAIEHLDGRVSDHDKALAKHTTDIALIQQKQRN